MPSGIVIQTTEVLDSVVASVELSNSSVVVTSGVLVVELTELVVKVVLVVESELTIDGVGEDEVMVFVVVELLEVVELVLVV